MIDLGMVAYMAYIDEIGDPASPPWESLHETQQNAWRTAADVVLDTWEDGEE